MTTYVRNPGALHATVNGSLVVLEPETLSYFELNVVGERVWALIDPDPRSVDDLVAVLLEEFDVDPERCREAVTAFLDEAGARGLVTRA